MAKKATGKRAGKLASTLKAVRRKLAKVATKPKKATAKKNAKQTQVAARRNRDDFPPKVLRLIANEVGNLCSNPGCGAPTSGPSQSRGASNVGTGAHITAAAPGGPRYDATLTPAERKAATNALWVCARCGRLVDNDDSTYTVDDLLDWKAQAIARAHRALETGKVLQTGPSKNSILHDKDVFARSDALMSERALRNHIDDALRMAAMNLYADKFVREWERFFELESNQYLIPALRSSAQETRSAMRAFDSFVALNFFVRGTKPRIYLRPQLNIDLDGAGTQEEMTAYDNHVDEMTKLGNHILDRYTVYRRAVKEHLFL